MHQLHCMPRLQPEMRAGRVALDGVAQIVHGALPSLVCRWAHSRIVTSGQRSRARFLRAIDAHAGRWRKVSAQLIQPSSLRWRQPCPTDCAAEQRHDQTNLKGLSMPTDQQHSTGAVPTSSSRNRFANKRMFIIVGAVAAVILLAVLYGVGLGVTA